MQTCQNCGTVFEAAAARAEYEAEFIGELQDENEYGNLYEDQACAACAISTTREHLEAGREMDFSLRTGQPPEDMPEDWGFSSDD